MHFYASYALASLWPQLQLSLQRDFAAAVPEDDRALPRTLLGNGRSAVRKVAGAVPHDLGSPCEEPWTKVAAGIRRRFYLLFLEDSATNAPSLQCPLQKTHFCL